MLWILYVEVAWDSRDAQIYFKLIVIFSNHCLVTNAAVLVCLAELNRVQTCKSEF